MSHNQNTFLTTPLEAVTSDSLRELVEYRRHLCEAASRIGNERIKRKFFWMYKQAKRALMLKRLQEHELGGEA